MILVTFYFCDIAKLRQQYYKIYIRQPSTVAHKMKLELTFDLLRLQVDYIL